MFKFYYLGQIYGVFSEKYFQTKSEYEADHNKKIKLESSSNTRKSSYVSIEDKIFVLNLSFLYYYFYMIFKNNFSFL